MHSPQDHMCWRSVQAERYGAGNIEGSSVRKTTEMPKVQGLKERHANGRAGWPPGQADWPQPTPEPAGRRFSYSTACRPGSATGESRVPTSAAAGRSPEQGNRAEEQRKLAAVAQLRQNASGGVRAESAASLFAGASHGMRAPRGPLAPADVVVHGVVPVVHVLAHDAWPSAAGVHACTSHMPCDEADTCRDLGIRGSPSRG